jgi:type VI secretion system secreted protein VgrG
LAIAKNRRVTIGGSKSETVGKTKTETIAMAKMLSIGVGYSINVGAAMNTIVGGFQTQQIGIYKRTDVLGGNYNISVASGSMIIEAAKEIRLKVGESELVMTAEGIVTLNGKKATFGLAEHMCVNSERIDLN